MDLSIVVNGMKFPNPFLLGSGPPGTNARVIAKSFDAGWGGAVGKSGQRSATLWKAALKSLRRSDRIRKHRADFRSPDRCLARGVSPVKERLSQPHSDRLDHGRV